MRGKQIEIWNGIFVLWVLFLGVLFVALSVWAESLGIKSNSDWGLSRILTAFMGLVFILFSFSFLFPPIKAKFQKYFIARYVVVSNLCILLVLLFSEILVRVAITQNPQTNFEKDWEVVPVAGSTMIWETEGSGITHFLHHGEIKTPFDDGVNSVVVLGDSHTAALQVSDNEKYSSEAEVLLRAGGQSINIHNLGKGGYGITDYIYLAPIIKKYYNPEIVVIQLSTGDFLGSIGGDSFNPLTHNNYFKVTDSSGLQLIHKFQKEDQGLFNYISSQSMLFTTAQDRYRLILGDLYSKWNINSNEFAPVLGNGSTILPIARINEQFRLLKDAYSWTKVILLPLPFTPNVDNDNINFKDPEYLKIMNAINATSGFYVLDPQKKFDNLVLENHLPRGFMNSLPGIGHLNIYGHQIIGKLLADKIIEVIK